MDQLDQLVSQTLNHFSVNNADNRRYLRAVMEALITPSPQLTGQQAATTDQCQWCGTHLPSPCAAKPLREWAAKISGYPNSTQHMGGLLWVIERKLTKMNEANTKMVGVLVDMLSGLEYLRQTRVPVELNGFGIDRLEETGKAALEAVRSINAA